MSRPGIFVLPEPHNEPVKDYAPGSPEREELKDRLHELENERMEIPLVIGGQDVRTEKTFESVMPHRRKHVLAEVSSGGPEHVQQAIDAAREAHHDWSRLPWEERAAVFLRAAELLAGPWRATVNAATMLGQSKTAHQAEIDAGCELTDFWRLNPSYMRRIYEEQVLADARQWAAELADGPTFANAMTKRMLEMEWAMSVETAIEAEAVAQALCMETQDFVRAFRAFAAKQKPVFEGN